MSIETANDDGNTEIRLMSVDINSKPIGTRVDYFGNMSIVMAMRAAAVWAAIMVKGRLMDSSFL